MGTCVETAVAPRHEPRLKRRQPGTVGGSASLSFPTLLASSGSRWSASSKQIDLASREDSPVCQIRENLVIGVREARHGPAS